MDRQQLSIILSRATQHIEHGQIKPIWEGGWRTSSLWEARPLIGQSNRGFHAGLRLRDLDGEGTQQWGPPVADKEQAARAAGKAMAAWEQGERQEFKALAAEIRHDEALARQRDAGLPVNNKLPVRGPSWNR